jgi:hypothetical protein
MEIAPNSSLDVSITCERDDIKTHEKSRRNHDETE